MKKIIKHTALLLAILCTGTTVTSCSEDTLTYVFNIISNFINTGQNYLYTGSATSQTLQGSTTEAGWAGTFINATEANPSGAYNFSGMEITLTTGNTAQIVIPAYVEGNASVSAITIGNLSLTPNADNTTATIDLTDDSTIDGTITYNDVAYTAANLYIEEAYVTETQLVLKMTIYYAGSDDSDYPIATNFDFMGTLPTTN